MLAELSSEQLSEWMTYFRFEPFAETYANERHGRLSMVVAAGGGMKTTIDDHIPKFGLLTEQEIRGKEWIKEQAQEAVRIALASGAVIVNG